MAASQTDCDARPREQSAVVVPGAEHFPSTPPDVKTLASCRIKTGEPLQPDDAICSRVRTARPPAVHGREYRDGAISDIRRP
mgnify:CR=1 FL=1